MLGETINKPEIRHGCVVYPEGDTPGQHLSGGERRIYVVLRNNPDVLLLWMSSHESLDAESVLC
jgi:hypothetical protein